MSSDPPPVCDREAQDRGTEAALADALYLLKDIKEQCGFVLTQPVGVEARTLATLIMQMIDPDESDDDD